MQDVSDRSGPAPAPADWGEADLGAVWQAVREHLAASLPEMTFKMWIEPLQAASRRENTLYLSAPDGIRTWVERRYGKLISDALSETTPALREVSFTAAEPRSPTAGAAREAEPLNPNYVFERFVIGDGNRLVHAAALAVAEAPSEAYNPLFLHGPPGLGKTHLLVAIANYLAANAPQLSVRYTTAESFTNEFVVALQTAGSEAFKRRYRDIDVLLIDDVQFLEGKHHTEEEFFHTFNALYESGSQIVLSADRMPSDLSTLASRLRDRFEWGLTLAVEPPNIATRLAVLRRLVGEAGVEIADRDALAELAARIDANVRQLHGALTRVLAHASLMAKPLSAELIAEVIPHRPRLTQSRPEQIQRQVAREFGVSREELIGPGRSATPLRARQVAIYLTRELTDLSLPQIGRLYGGRDHSTVLGAVRRIDAQLSADPQLVQRLQELRTAIHSSLDAGR